MSISKAWATPSSPSSRASSAPPSPCGSTRGGRGLTLCLGRQLSAPGKVEELLDRCGFTSLNTNRLLSGQMADHSRLEQGMLRVRIPPEPLIGSTKSEIRIRRKTPSQSSLAMLAILSRWRSWVQIPSGALFG